MIKKFLALLVVLFFLVFVPPPSSAEQLTILHTNDTHSHLYSFGPMNRYGGIARMSYLIKKLKRKNGWQNRGVIALNSGDVFVGTFAFNKYLGYAELKLMEGLYDSMALGNHEFDLGIDNLTAIISGVATGEDSVQLPMLCANIKNLDPGHPLRLFVQPYRILQAGSLKIGLTGVVTTDPINYSEEVNAILTDPYQAAGEAAALLKQQGCDIVICQSHLGKIADVQGLAWVDGIDVIVGGHSHDAIAEPLIVNGKIIVQAGEFGKFLGELVVDVTQEGVECVSYKLHPIDWSVRRDLTLLRNLYNLRKGIEQDPRFGPVYTTPIAWAKYNHEEHWEEGNPHRDTPLGNLVADAIRNGVEDGGFSLGPYPLAALEAMGYIAHRIYKGKVVGNDVMRSVPYGYDPSSGLGFKIHLVLLAGAQILAGLEYTVSMVEYTDEISLQASGITFEYDSAKSPASTLDEILMGMGRIDPSSVRVNGDPLDPQGLYQVAMNEQLVKFLKSLGMEPIMGMDVDTGLFLYSVVRDYMQKLKILEYVSEGRIIDRAFLE
jgi:2',3'-cyclic-nucleotide 2'-phosphodiesterase (5'-nucleotidase family)